MSAHVAAYVSRRERSDDEGRALSARLNEGGGLSGSFPRHAGKRASQTAEHCFRWKMPSFGFWQWQSTEEFPPNDLMLAGDFSGAKQGRQL